MKQAILSSILVAFLALPVAAQEHETARFVALEGVKNTRDLGGLTTEHGRMVRTGQLIRSGEIDHISPDGMAALEDMSVSTIIDLRTTKEATRQPAEWPHGSGPERVNLKLLEAESDKIDEMRNRIASGTAEAAWMDQSFLETF
ncbi:tyrosine-protein phosphatase [Aliiruegeria lutimaris]|uniref:Tyrosine phosphatase family protein n=1 Tax=Aliiruegeria lutimaris TaxID=571298 RepID=A0A1G9DKI9_9RHOB|nr:tyrosine-protein phosphatase [Aliiruegeria lutimaris]SDK64310.1 Tyrosine phosphatase family protein [Aliiruegeria lutimaris]